MPAVQEKGPKVTALKASNSISCYLLVFLKQQLRDKKELIFGQKIDQLYVLKLIPNLSVRWLLNFVKNLGFLPTQALCYKLEFEGLSFILCHNCTYLIIMYRLALTQRKSIYPSIVKAKIRSLPHIEHPCQFLATLTVW